MSRLEKILKYLIYGALIVFSAFLVFELISDIVLSCSVGFPREYREAAVIEYERYILSEGNPYTLESLEAAINSPFYMYPFIYGYIAAGMASLTHIDLVFMNYLISLLSIIISSLLLSFIVYKKTENVWYSLLAFPLGISCHWRGGFVAAFPDDFAMLLFMIILCIILSKSCRRKEILAATAVVLLLFTKQYFILLAVPLFFYFAVISKKSLLTYIGSGILIGGVSIALISYFMPLYWTYSIYFMSGSASHFSISNLLYVIEQYKTIGVIYFSQLFFVFLYLFLSVKRRAKEKKFLEIDIKDFNRPLFRTEGDQYITFLWSGFWTIGLLVVYFACNRGTYLTYILQLWCPFAIMIAAICTTKLMNISTSVFKWKTVVNVLLMFAITFMSTIYLYSKVDIIKADQSIAEQWNAAYRLVDEYKGQEISCSPLFSYKAFSDGLEVFDTGQGAYAMAYEKYLNDERAQKRFPSADQIYLQRLHKREQMRNKAQNGEYALILREEAMDIVFDRELLSDQYHILTTIPLVSGNHIWNTEFWVKNE